jgi:hypothetical protein
MDVAFAIAARRRPGRWKQGPFLDVGSPDAEIIGFEPNAHMEWHNADGSLTLVAWQGANGWRNAVGWRVDGDQVVIATGHHRWRGERWAHPADWTMQLASRVERQPLAKLVVDELQGVFALAHLRATGDGTVVTDPLGLRCLYYGQTPEVFVVASRSALVAAVLAAPNMRPKRDARSTSTLAYESYRIGTASGFEDVQVVPAGGVVELRAGAEPAIQIGAPWMPPTDICERSTDELVEHVRDDIADSLRAVISFPADRRVFGLTGGKDSRLLLAVALWAGIAEGFDYETIGPPDFEDVRIASELAADFGLRHEVRFYGIAAKRSYGERLHEFVERTSGLLNGWNLGATETDPTDLRVTGLCGEMLRTFRPLPRPVVSVAQLLEQFSPRTFGRLGLVKPDVARALREEALDALLDDPSGRATPQDLFDAFYNRNRLRFTRIGPREELGGEFRVVPLGSVNAVSAAFALGGAARQAELLHYEITRRCVPALANREFAGPGWDEQRLAEVGSGSAFRKEEPTIASGAAQPVAKPESLIRHVQQVGFDDRKEVLYAAVRDRSNPAFEYIDHGSTLAAFERFASLKPVERRELFGACTAAMWLGGA